MVGAGVNVWVVVAGTSVGRGVAVNVGNDVGAGDAWDVQEVKNRIIPITMIIIFFMIPCIQSKIN